MNDLQNSYDLVAKDYAEQFIDEFEHKPFDRKMLDFLAEKVARLGAICDMGCGPGQAARYLFEKGIEACGVDSSAEMVEAARALNPEIEFRQGDMLALDEIEDESFGGIAALYSIIHIPRESLAGALSELERVLRRGGALLVAFHIGRETIHRDEWFDQKVSLDFIFYETSEIKRALEDAGFTLEEVIERDPYAAQIEYPSRRAYVFARKP